MKRQTYSLESILNYIVTYKRAHDGNSPAIHDIRTALNISSASVVWNALEALVRSGAIRIGEGQSRMIYVVGGKWEYVKGNPDHV